MRYTADKFAADLEHAYAWPGGYPRYFLTSDGGALSHKAATENKWLIRRAIRTNDTRSGWCVIECDINWEDPDLVCDHTGERIESAYEKDRT